MRTVLFTILRANSKARLRRIRTAFSTPRRVLLSLLVLVLAVVWTGQTVASMLLREPYAPEDFRRWVAIPLFAWFLWHLVRVAWKRPESAIEWSEEEESLIVAGPFSAREQILYRIVVILTATLPKAVLTILVLWPDLSWSSPVGLILALVGLELFRMVMDISTCCLTVSASRIYRYGIVATLALLAFACQPPPAVQVDGATTQEIVQLLRNQQPSRYIHAVLQNEVVATLAVPFLYAADVVAGQGTTLTLVAKIVGMLGGLAVLTWLICRLESTWRKVLLRREREQWQRATLEARVVDVSFAVSSCLPRIPFCGPLIWRQSKRAFRFCGSLLISMAIPAVLLSPSLVTVANPVVAFLLVVCGSLFYTFVLLPEAIKFDFRLDSDHLCQLKMLPMTPTRVVIGQLTIPVLLACLFQAIVMIAAGVYRSIDGQLIVAAIALSVPLTILFVALDNLTFLLYPHRPTQEGFEAFLRTVLKFTGKSVLLALFAGAVFLWAPLAAAIAGQLGMESARTVFAIGMIFGVSGLATLAVGCVVSAFRRFDVSLHGIT